MDWRGEIKIRITIKITIEEGESAQGRELGGRRAQRSKGTKAQSEGEEIGREFLRF